ncbi:FAD/NAD(P)-binding domain-containing protein [Exidia glandulosa HHB12029]|uniref:FAD/NAD(P)-binding domain-containing protein n=1 Tax=Exidia glandulosa HHB12029 TaxID=1314781 RepID=A0A165QPN1_EXIGL|nr:FAD/NAD(P)-binding domain-containing protein [Exidia glandulosa HHB12029]
MTVKGSTRTMNGISEALARFELQASPQTASLLLHVLVIGGGTTGLAAAYAIRQAGHTVHVLEARPGLEEDHNCAYIPPNLWHVLDKWGLHDKLMERSSRVASMTFKAAATGDTLTHMRWHEGMIQDSGSPMHRIFRSDLRDIMYETAISAGVEVSFNSKVVGVDLDGPCVILENGDILDADLIVGADGANGAIRRVVLNSNADPPPEPVSYYRGVLQKDILLKDPLFANHPEDEIISWLHPGMFASLVPGGPNNSYFSLECLRRLGSSESLLDFDPLSLREQVLREHEGCEPQLRRAIELMEEIQKVVEADRKSLTEWSHETGRLVCVGSACHPMTFPAAQDCALAAEDAVVLGNFLSRVTALEQLPYLLDAYEEVRQFRCEVVVGRETIQRQLMVGNPGSTDMQPPASTPDDLQEGFSQGTYDWQDGAPTFLHDALGEAELWWQHWGQLLGGPRHEAYSTEESEFEFSDPGSRKQSLVVEYSIAVEHHQ